MHRIKFNTIIFLKLGMGLLLISILFYSYIPFGVGENEKYLIDVSDEIIRINGNSELDTFCSIGNGTQENPFIIENLTIDASDATGILITQTDMFLTIRNCSITNGGDLHTGIILSSSKNVKIINNTLTHNSIGIRLDSGSCDNMILENNCSNNNLYGIVITSMSNHNNISSNDCSYGGIGIYIVNESDNMIISNNNCTYNSNTGIIILFDGWGCQILSNNCSYNNGNGLSNLDCCSSNKFLENDFSHNKGHGINVWNSNNCQISDNNCSYNEGYGIRSKDSSSLISRNYCSFNNDSEIYLNDQMELVVQNFDHSDSSSEYNYNNEIVSYWLNDTTHFHIDSNGLISNITNLLVGTYGLEIHVTDSRGNEIVGEIFIFFDGINDPFKKPKISGFSVEIIISCLGISYLIMIMKKRRFIGKNNPTVSDI